MSDITSIVTNVWVAFKNTILSAEAGFLPQFVADNTKYALSGEERLKDLATGALNGQLSWAFVVKRLTDEETTLKDILIGDEQDIATNVQQVVGTFEGLLKTQVASLP